MKSRVNLVNSDIKEMNVCVCIQILDNASCELHFSRK